MIKNNVALHNENGITQLKINGTEISGVSDYKIASSANGKTELTFTISADNIATDVEIDLAENKQVISHTMFEEKYKDKCGKSPLSGL